MNLPLPLDLAPMEAETASDIPAGPEWQYEPKWDGFRCLAFRQVDEVELMSKSGQALARYFPEIVAALGALPARQFVVDGELIVSRERMLDFDALLQRIHPAASRIRKLSVDTPATFLLFDLLLDASGRDLTSWRLSDRRQSLEAFIGYPSNQALVRLSPQTASFEEARSWFLNMAGPLDGIIAKRTDRPYASGLRHSMLKIKNLRTADCVVGGFRYGTGQKTVGSLLLGLYDQAGLLNHVGFTSSLSRDEKANLTPKLEELIQEPGFSGAKPGGPSRWSTERSAAWKPLASRLVVEVQYDHFAGDRFRHGTRILRWRTDKPPVKCLLEQVKRDAESPLTLLD